MLVEVSLHHYNKMSVEILKIYKYWRSALALLLVLDELFKNNHLI